MKMHSSNRSYICASIHRLLITTNPLLRTTKNVIIRDRQRKILESNASMLQYYASVVDVKSKSSIYTNFIDDRRRSVITRWRLSNHKLFIETGRYRLPYVERKDRQCFECNILEDESHAIFFCPAFAFSRAHGCAQKGICVNPCFSLELYRGFIPIQEMKCR